MGEALKQAGLRAYYTRSQLERGDAPNTEIGLKYLHSYSPLGGWYVLGVPPPFTDWLRGRNRSRYPVHLRHSCAAGFLRSAFPAGNLSHPRRAGGPGGDTGFAAGHQRSHSRRRPGPDRGAGAAAPRGEFRRSRTQDRSSPPVEGRDSKPSDKTGRNSTQTGCRPKRSSLRRGRSRDDLSRDRSRS